LAVVALLGNTSARQHRHAHKLNKHHPKANNMVQFIDGDFDSEESFAQGAPISNPAYPGVRFVQQMSDPISGSLGNPKAKRADLTPEQQFEWDMRRIPQVKLEDEVETVTDTKNSIEAAEKIVGGKMVEPKSAKQLAKEADRSVEYPEFDSDDEDDETVETRRSIKTAEKMYKQRFFINAKDRRDYEAKVLSGQISQEELEFAEAQDQEIGQNQAEVAKKEAEKKEAVIASAAKAEAEKGKT
jgi:hypothetical protein